MIRFKNWSNNSIGYKKIIRHMEKQGVLFAKGLTENDILKIQKKYNFIFPKELKNFLKTMLPISDGYYNWLDYRKENIFCIYEALSRPQKDIIDLAEEIEWCDKWGEEPLDIIQKKKIITEKVLEAPSLIPIFGHRYMVSGDYRDTPVISIMGTDLIYYGKNLYDYLQIESGIKQMDEIYYDDIMYVPFWSDIIENY